MKKIFLALCFIGTLAFTQELSPKAKEAARSIVLIYGYTCDFVDFSHRSSWDGSIRLSCNGARYVYELKDEGGIWKVKVK